MPVWLPHNDGPNIATAYCQRCTHKRQYADLRQDPNDLNYYCRFGCIDIFDPWRLPTRTTENISLEHARPQLENYDTFYPPQLTVQTGDIGPDVAIGGFTVTKTTNVGTSAYRASAPAEVNSGRWYFEVTINRQMGLAAQTSVGVAIPPIANQGVIGGNALSWGYLADGTVLTNGVANAYGATYTAGDIIGVAVDMKLGNITFYKNNAIQGVAFTNLLTSVAGVWAAGSMNGILSQQTLNLGTISLAFLPPKGFSPMFNVANAFPYPANTQLEVNVA